MAFSQLDWVALFIISILQGFPYIREWNHVSGIMMPGDFYKDKSRKHVPIAYRTVWSADWYESMRARVGWWAPDLWLFPVVWVAVWFTAVASTWFVWSNRDNYSQNPWDAFLGMQMAISLLSALWFTLFLRSRNHVRSAAISTMIAAAALASLGISLDGSFSGSGGTTPDGILYIPVAAYWTWMMAISWTVLIIHWKGGFDGATFQPIFLHTTQGNTHEFPQMGSFIPVQGQRINVAYGKEDIIPDLRRGDMESDSDV
jgi:tryptophan-rich sensory protein